MSQKSPEDEFDEKKRKVLRTIRKADADGGLDRHELADRAELSEETTNAVVNELADRGELNVTVDWKLKSKS
jgi:DNA-binding transcriptional regulator LsrR (DeoR family)